MQHALREGRCRSEKTALRGGVRRSVLRSCATRAATADVGVMPRVCRRLMLLRMAAFQPFSSPTRGALSAQSLGSGAPHTRLRGCRGRGISCSRGPGEPTADVGVMSRVCGRLPLRVDAAWSAVLHAREGASHARGGQLSAQSLGSGAPHTRLRGCRGRGISCSRGPGEPTADVGVMSRVCGRLPLRVDAAWSAVLHAREGASHDAPSILSHSHRWALDSTHLTTRQERGRRRQAVF